MIPTADDVASVVVSACRETGEDPLACYTPQTAIHARQYAYQALADVFDHNRRSLARMVGCTGEPLTFVTSVKHNIAPHPRRDHRAAWWNDGALDRVTAVARARLSLRPVCITCGDTFPSAEAFEAHDCADRSKPLKPQEPQKGDIALSVAKTTRFPKAPTQVNQIPESRPVAEPPPRPQIAPPFEPAPPPRRRGYDMLADAVRRTAAMTPPPEED